MQKCKITVLKREFYPDLAKEYIPFPDFGPCEMMKSLYFETLLCRRKRNGTGDAEQVRNDAPVLLFRGNVLSDLDGT